MNRLGKAEGLTEGLTEGLKTLLEAIQNNQGIQLKDLSLILDRSIKTLERQIAELINQRKVERRGSRKTGGYFIIK